MSQFIKAGKAPLLLAGASVGLVSWGNTHHHHAHKDAAGAKPGTPRAAKQYVLTSPRGIFALSPGPAQCEGSASGPAGSRPMFVSTSRRGDRMAVAAEAEARVKAKGFLRDVISMWETSTESDTHPWVWLDRNPTTPTHVFVGDAPGLLPKIQAAAQRDPNSALVLVRPSHSHFHSHASSASDAALLRRLGVAVLDGAVERVDPQTGVLLTRDERVILFDSLTVQWGVRDRAGIEAAAAAALHDDDDEEEQHAIKARRPRGEIVRPGGKIVPASASAAAAASAAMQQGGKGGASSGAAASGCNRGCSRIVRRKSLHATGEGLHHIVASWRLSRTDTWPWVWLARNEHGPGLHVVVASGREALAAADDRLAECSSSTSTSSGGCNVLVVGRAGDGVAASEYDKRGCARIEAEVEELDAAHGIVMLDDERIIEFDSLTFIHSERTGEA